MDLFMLLRTVTPILVVISIVAADYKQVDDSNCDCYLTNGSTGHYFTTHKFYDFRSMSKYVKVPQLIDDPFESSNVGMTNEYFYSQEWTEAWGIQAWNNTANLDDGNAAVFMVNSPNNVYIEKNADPNPASDTFMTLRTARMEGFQSAAEIESISQGYHFLSSRMYARTIGKPGGITAMFTYRGSSDPMGVQESDLEVRTEDPTDFIQYTNQPSYGRTGNAVAAATRNASVPVRWDEWAVHRLDWISTSTSWYVDGQNVSQIPFQTPRDPSQVIFNAWSDGSQWAGNMSAGDEAYLQIQWIEIVYNTTGSEKTTDASRRLRSRSWRRLFRMTDNSDGCNNVCSIDETDKIGTAVLIQGSSAPARLGAGWFVYFVSFIPLFVMTTFLF